jgi:nucleoside-diphosphate-sugar epimerase
MKVLFIGGTGTISSACAPLAVERGVELTLFNRGQSTRAMPEGARVVHGDIRDRESARSALGNETFDVVVDWVAFTPKQIEMDLELFRGRTCQFIFISSASVYQSPPARLPVTEETPLENPYWQYSRDKIACEERLMRAYREEQFPVTVVRPSHTYDQRTLPLKGRYTAIDRMRRGKKVIVHGDGSSLWVMTHHQDFAKGFVGLLGNEKTIGEAFQITSDELLTWNQIYQLAAGAASTTADILHVPTDLLAQYDAEWGAELRGDKAHSMVFDNSKIKHFVPDFAAATPFARGVEEIMAWHDADPSRQVVDKALDELMDRIVADNERAFGNLGSSV